MSYLFTIWLKLLDISSKNKVLFCFGSLYANKAHHFFLEIVSSKQVVSENLVSWFSNLLAIIPCFTFPPPFEVRSLRKDGNWEFSKINYEFGKLPSNLVSSTQNSSKGTFAIFSLRLMIFKTIRKTWTGLPIKSECHQRSRSGDFIVKLKKKYTFLPFYVWISEFRMGGYFLKTCFLNRQFKQSSEGTVLNFHGIRHRVTADIWPT